MLGSWWKKSAAVALAGLAFYALAGFLIAPDLLKHTLRNSVSEHGDRKLSIGGASVNPFTFDLKLTDLRLKDSAGAPSASVDQIHARLHPASLFRQAWLIRDMVIGQPRVSFQAVTENGELSTPVSSYLPAAVTAIADSTDWSIERLVVHQGELHIGTAAAVPPVNLSDMEIRIQNLRTKPGARGNFTLNATINHSARLEGKGWLAPTEAEIEADFSVSGVDAPSFGSYVDLGPAVELASARLAANASLIYRTGRLHLEGEIEVHDVEVVDALSGAPVFSAAALYATGMAIDPSSQRTAVKSITVENPYLNITRDAGRDLNLQQWLLPRTGNDPNAHTTQTAYVIDTIEVHGGRAEFIDLSMSPPVRMTAEQISGTLTQDGASPETSATLKLDGKINESGAGSISASWHPYAPDHSTVAELRLRDIGLTVLSPYFSSFAGREITHGDLSLDLDYEISNHELVLHDRFAVEDLVLGRRAETPMGADLPLDLAVALLKDNNGLLRFSIPVPRTPVSEGFDPPAILGRATRDFVTGLAEDPFAIIGDLTGQGGTELSNVIFAAGSAAITQTQEQSLAMLGAALSQRPGLDLRIYPGYDPVADRHALARQQMRLHIALATSAGPPGSASRKQLALNDPKVTAILDEFATNRLGQEQLAAIGARFSSRDDAYYQDIFDALVANEKVSTLALSTLARYRAQSVVGQLMSHGIDAERLEIADEIHSTAAEYDAVSLSLDLIARNAQQIIISPKNKRKSHLY